MTPKDYEELAKKVYSVDSNFKDGKVTHKGQEFNLNGKRWKVLEAKDNQGNGFQGMAVAPMKKGKTDTSQIVVAYAGTNSSDWKDLTVDGPNVMESLGGLQLASANQFAKVIEKAYPNSDISTTGHSLGAFLSLAQGAEHHWQSVTFNGPDPYSVLSSQAKEWVKENPGMLTNFLNQMDLVGYGGDIVARFKNGKLLWCVLGIKMSTTGSEVVLDYGFQGINPLNYHDIDLWKFDKNGNLLDGNGNSHKIPEKAVLNSSMNLLANSFQVHMKNLGDLKERLTASGGELSSGEKIYLDSAQALAIVTTASSEFDLSMKNVRKIYQEGVQESEKLWSDTFLKATGMGNLLETWEIYEALEVVGFTQDNIVGFPTEQYQSKIDKVRTMSDEFKSLESEIKEKISELVARDSELAQQLKG
ncbi:hypothetical protein [Enterococcus thailandicus]|uniref:hypothetical protein n=1 Tax=Enterococcus thailandicus TaxID=417368 RepID=UPI0022E4A93E|nr:hypothetical protein [Enterococcus thailandicus]